MHLELPSQYTPYNFKSVNLNDNIGPIYIPAFARAVEDDDLKYLLQGVQKAIDIDVGMLTEGDFYYTLTVMRILAYKKNPLMARWTCSGSEVFKRLDTGETWTEEQVSAYVDMWHAAEDKTGITDPDDIQIEPTYCTHQNEEVVGVGDLILHTLPTADETPYDLDSRLDYPRASLLPEAYELSDDLEYGPFVRVAKWVRAGETLVDKIEMVMNNMELYELALHAERNYRHGVTRYIVKTCKACGNHNTLEMEVSAMSFL